MGEPTQTEAIESRLLGASSSRSISALIKNINNIDMEDGENQQFFSLRWNNHQNLVMEALGGILQSGRWTDVTLSAGGRTMKAHRLVLAACSRYFADLFKETEDLGPPLVVVAGCSARELRLLLRLLYTGQATAPRDAVRPLLRLAAALHVTGLKECNTNISDSSEIQCEVETNKRTLESELCQTPSKRRYLNPHNAKYFADNRSLDEEQSLEPPRPNDCQKRELDKANANTNIIPNIDVTQNLWKTNSVNLINSNSTQSGLTETLRTPTNRPDFNVMDQNIEKNLKKCSKLNKIVESLHCSRSAKPIQKEFQLGKLDIDLFKAQETCTETTQALHSKSPALFADKKARTPNAGSAVCAICSKRLSNQYNLRVHMETHAGTRHACSSCTHISRSKDALRKHVAYRHPNVHKIIGKGQLH